jgi:predicted TIM-barrel fold metal-dependent hydrolase
MPAPGEFVSQMKAAGAKAVRLFPNLHSYSLSDWCAGEMLDAFEASRVPVFIETGQANYEVIASVLKSHPKLRLTVVQTSYRGDRYLYPLFEKCEQLSIESSSYVVTGGIEGVCERFGASRVVFGTGMPFFEPGNAVALITYAQIPDKDKQAVASGNLERLLAWS